MYVDYVNSKACTSTWQTSRNTAPTCLAAEPLTPTRTLPGKPIRVTYNTWAGSEQARCTTTQLRATAISEAHKRAITQLGMLCLHLQSTAASTRPRPPPRHHHQLHRLHHLPVQGPRRLLPVLVRDAACGPFRVVRSCAKLCNESCAKMRMTCLQALHTGTLQALHTGTLQALHTLRHTAGTAHTVSSAPAQCWPACQDQLQHSTTFPDSWCSAP
jgi:hypothetical protein